MKSIDEWTRRFSSNQRARLAVLCTTARNCFIPFVKLEALSLLFAPYCLINPYLTSVVSLHYSIVVFLSWFSDKVSRSIQLYLKTRCVQGTHLPVKVMRWRGSGSQKMGLHIVS